MEKVHSNKSVIRSNICPACGASECVDGGHIEITERWVEHHCSCLECNAEWVSHYLLQHQIVRS